MERPQQNNSNKTMSAGRKVLSILIGLLGVFIFFRQFILSGGRRIVGDMADGRLIMCIHEHWYRFLMGKEAFFELGFFYPEKNVLGYSDTFFLGGLIHSIFRLIGLDVFLSFQLVQISTAILGFSGLFTWLKNYREVGYFSSLFASLLFIIATPIFISSRNSHIQMQAVWLVPWILILCESCWLKFTTGDRQLRWSFLALCICFGLVTYSTFYVAWFFLLFSVIWLLCCALLTGLNPVIAAVSNRFRTWPQLLPGLISLFAIGSLFLVTYLPVRSDKGVRTYEEVVQNMPPVWDLINHSESNLFWGTISSLLKENAPNQLIFHQELGFSPILLVLTIILSIELLGQRQYRNDINFNFPRITALAFLISLLLLVRIEDFSLWRIPYSLLPGGDGIRVVQRYTVLLVIPMLFLISWSFSWRKKHSLGISNILTFGFLGSFLIIEQLHSGGNSSLDRIEQLERLHSLPKPPEDATAFYILGECNWASERDITQSSAILYSQHWNLPTVSGRSGFIPNNWYLFEPREPDVTRGLLRWGNIKDIHGKIYGFDATLNRWGPGISFPTSAWPLDYGDKNLLDPDFFPYFVDKGWSQPEPWGVWNDGEYSILRFPPVSSPGESFELVLGLRAFVRNNHLSQNLLVLLDGKEVFQKRFSMEDPEANISIELTKSAIDNGFTLEFFASDSVSPKAIGLSNDPRVLGVGLTELLARKML